MFIQIMIFGLLGWVSGWLLYYAADILPRYSSNHMSDKLITLAPPALIGIIRGQQPATGGQRERLLTELAAGIGCAVTGAHFGLATNAVLYSGILIYLLLLVVIDLRYRLVLNVMVYPAIGSVVAAHLIRQPEHTPEMLVGGMLAFSVFALTAYLMPGKVGGGDVKLALLLGVAFGFPGVLWALLVGGSAGAAVAIYLLVRNQPEHHAMPYAPFLCLGALVALVYNPFLGWV